jgi:S-formylglutathione hydrolase FrmB
LVGGLGGLAALVGAGAVGVELVSHNVLPGQSELNQLDGACSVSAAPWRFARPGTEHSGTFYSEARRRDVGYTIAYPPGHGPGSVLPLVVVLHGYGANHTNALSGLTLAEACAVRVDGQALAPMALVAADGGGGYWNPHPGDDPMGMVIDELIPMCRDKGLGRSPHHIGTLGISMGGYGALLLAERYPGLFAAAAAISPAIWTSYPEARAANAGAYASAEDFRQNDVVTHAEALVGVAVRLASGDRDPFHPGVEAMVRQLPRDAVVELSNGCHTGPFFQAQEGPSLAFLARHLST